MNAYGDWFRQYTGHAPHPWQNALAADSGCKHRLVRIPTGLGKTAGVVMAWVWNRAQRADKDWPRRLVFCLPMRVLVEQTEEEIRKWLSQLGLLWDGQGPHGGKVGVHVLMGGAGQEEWHLHPEENAILIGTQDMLLSRALNRGYGSARGRWPMEFGLLSQDSLWVLDEVQLMGVGLTTSAQLQTFREDDRSKELRPSFSWWMSATLQPQWLKTVDSAPLVSEVEASGTLQISTSDRTGEVWETEKPLRVVEISSSDDKNAARWAQVVLGAHSEIVDATYGRITLAIANTVREASDLFDALTKATKKADGAPEICLVHSRFRGLEKASWRGSFLSRNTCTPETNRIIVATQVVEAGVDISAAALVTQAAPWPSLVQRFGRAARYGGKASITVIDRSLETPLPYAANEIAASKEALAKIDDVRQARLEDFETDIRSKDPEFLHRLYPYEPLHVLTRREMDELIDTSADLTGSDLDISRFIREGEERDLNVFWYPFEEKVPNRSLQPTRLGLCAVPINEDARKWLRTLRTDGLAWVWDYHEGSWRRYKDADFCPGQTLLIHTKAGGYTPERGWDPKAPAMALPLAGTTAEPTVQLAADMAESREDLSATERYKTIATHGGEVRDCMVQIAATLELPATLLKAAALAARWHDLGKAHEVFNAAILDKGDFVECNELAKAPGGCWASPGKIFAGRRGFRHELASTLALFEFLRCSVPEHPAIQANSDQNPVPNQIKDQGANNALAAELAALSAEEFDLVAWLVCTHHGKVRCAWQATTHDQESKHGHAPPLLRGICDGDVLPATRLMTDANQVVSLPPLSLNLALASIGLSPAFGRSWIDRVDGLTETYGPFTLAYLEALFRTADIRASRLSTSDPLLEGKSQ